MNIAADAPTIIGIAASVCTGGCLIPQLITILQKKKAENVSVGMLVVMFTGVSLWVVYGVYKKDWIIIISNSFSILINAIITILSIRYKLKSKPQKLRRI
jgi:MtN3 and saliva related transmembrane protein